MNLKISNYRLQSHLPGPCGLTFPVAGGQIRLGWAGVISTLAYPDFAICDWQKRGIMKVWDNLKVKKLKNSRPLETLKSVPYKI